MFFGRNKKAAAKRTTGFDDFVDNVYVKHMETGNEWVKMKDLTFGTLQYRSSCQVGFEKDHVAFTIYGCLAPCSDLLKGLFYYTKIVMSSDHERIDDDDIAEIIKAFFEVFDYDNPNSPYEDPTPQMISRSYYGKAHDKENAYKHIMVRELREATGVDISSSALMGYYVQEIDKRFHISSKGYIFKKENKDA